MVSSPLLPSCPPRMKPYTLLCNLPPATSTQPGTSLREPLGEPGSLKSKLMALLEEDGAVSFPTVSLIAFSMSELAQHFLLSKHLWSYAGSLPFWGKRIFQADIPG